MKNILLAISGLTPQIVTETLFALSVQKNIPIDQIYVLTTERGKKVLEGKDKAQNTPVTSLKKEIEQLCKSYNLKKPVFSLKRNVIVAEEESTELYDIKTDNENILFPNKASELVQKLTSIENSVLFVSISGGRKSMSAHLALVMSLFARPHDKLFHVITDARFEFKNFYPTSVEEANALVLAELPFVKLRCLNNPLLRNQKSYSDIVTKTQEKLLFLTDNSKLVIELRERKIRYKDNFINLPPTQLIFYFLFIQKKIASDTGFSITEIILPEFAVEMKNMLEEYYHQHFNSNDKNHWSVRGFTTEYILSIKSKINSKLKELFDNQEITSEFLISSERHWGDSKYFIKAPKDKLGVNYE